MTLSPVILERLKRSRSAERQLRTLPPSTKNAVLREVSRLLAARQDEIIAANAADLQALPADATSAFRDRLTLNAKRIGLMRDSLEEVAKLPDPVDEEVESKVLKNGLRARRVRSPLGVILMIFESRPNVAVESFSLAFKSGNAAILRGGKESMRTTAVLYSILEQALASQQVSGDCVWGITDPDRGLVQELLQQSRYIDVVVPRGGEGLIDFVVRHSRIPIIKNDRGLCHVYVHEDADPGMALRIVVNAKTQRPGVCNAMETLLVHERLAPALLPELHARLERFGVQWFGCPRTVDILKGKTHVEAAAPSAFDTEYLDLKMSCQVVSSFDQAIAHIEEHGSRHSEAIVTSSPEVARRFEGEVDAAAVYWNASTRFTDGFELGLGGELGISTQKLHVRGPVGLRELTSARWVIEGEGQIRE